MKKAIKEFLLKYCDPKPEYDGISADELAEMLIDKINEEIKIEKQ